MFTVKDLINQLYSNAWQSRMLAKVERVLGLTANTLVKPSVAFSLATCLTKLTNKFKGKTHEFITNYFKEISQQFQNESVDDVATSSNGGRGDIDGDVNGSHSINSTETGRDTVSLESNERRELQRSDATEGCEDKVVSSEFPRFIQDSLDRTSELFAEQHERIVAGHERVVAGHERIIRVTEGVVRAIGAISEIHDRYVDVDGRVAAQDVPGIEPTTIEVKSETVPGSQLQLPF